MRFPQSPTLRNRSGRLAGHRYARTPAAGAAAAAAFNLADLNPIAWWDMSDTGSITESAGAISQVDDQTANNNHLLQGTGADQPATGGSINGNNSAVFFDDHFNLTTSLTTVRAAFVVTDNLVGSNVSANVCPIIGETGTSDGTFVRTNNLDYSVSVDGGGGNSGAAAYNGGTRTTGTNIDLGVSNAEEEGPLVWYFEWDAGQDVEHIGRLNTGSVYNMRGDIGEVLLLDTVPSADDRASAFAALQAKWGIS